MIKNALGLIEIVGLAGALAAADAAVKAANVSLLGYELTKGGGLVTIKLVGDVGAVKAAVDAGRQAGAKVNTVYATHVIPRPHQELECIVNSQETVGAESPAAVVSKPVVAETIGVDDPADDNVSLLIVDDPESGAVTDNAAEELLPQPVLTVADEEKLFADVAVSEVSPAAESAVTTLEVLEVKVGGEVCNLCNDPACSRKKGEPRTSCVQHGK